MDNMVLFMRGPDDGQMRVALREDSGIKLDEFRERLRKVAARARHPLAGRASGAGRIVARPRRSGKPSLPPSASSRATSSPR